MKKRYLLLVVSVLALVAAVPFLVSCDTMTPTPVPSDPDPAPEVVVPEGDDDVFPADFGEYVERELDENTTLVTFGSEEMAFNVTANLIIRNGDALLIDTKFTQTDAQEIVNYLKNADVDLTQIFISHGDPDYYFGLERIKQAYPDVIAYTTPSVAQHVANTMLNKLEVWGEVLGDEQPDNLVMPKIFEATSFEFNGLTLEVFGSDPTRITVYIPEYNLLLGGPTIVSGNHVFLADMSTTEDRQRWLDNLTELQGLNAEIVVPGHTVFADETYTAESIDFTIGYIQAVNEILPTVQNSEEFIAAMEERYPDLQSREVLVLAGQVLTGEMTWA